jgi:peptidoglycan-N-acetylglucosamine deacetylase
MYLSYPPQSYRWMLPGDIQWNLGQGQERDKEPRLALTFDDGPDPDITPQVLDILDAYKAKATFFCTGRNLVANPELASEILARGHRIGNHGFHHLDGWTHSSRLYFRDVLEREKLMHSDLFRPPYGRIRPAQAKALSRRFRIVMWSLLSGDFDPHLGTDKCLAQLKRKTQNGDIVVFHDAGKGTGRMLLILPKYLDFLRDGSYFFDFC